MASNKLTMTNFNSSSFKSIQLKQVEQKNEYSIFGEFVNNWNNLTNKIERIQSKGGTKVEQKWNRAHHILLKPLIYKDLHGENGGPSLT